MSHWYPRIRSFPNRNITYTSSLILHQYFHILLIYSVSCSRDISISRVSFYWVMPQLYYFLVKITTSFHIFFNVSLIVNLALRALCCFAYLILMIFWYIRTRVPCICGICTLPRLVHLFPVYMYFFKLDSLT